jgi:hypothetical protein
MQVDSLNVRGMQSVTSFSLPLSLFWFSQKSLVVSISVVVSRLL